MHGKRRSRHNSGSRPGRSGTPSTRAAHGAEAFFELEIIPGLAEFAQAELREKTGNRAQLLPSAREDRVRFRYAGSLAGLLQLRRSVAVHRVKRFAIPRPKALLGHQNFSALIGLVQEALALHEPGNYKTIFVSAAGSSSSVFSRIKAEIETRTGLQCTEEPGDFLLAVRRSAHPFPDPGEEKDGWEVAVRLSPRPLSARGWRVCDMPGALNGTVASTMMSLVRPSPRDRVINLACGSGTLLIERLALTPLQGAVGCDIDAYALACARRNLIASGDANAARLVCCDAAQVPLHQRWATTVCVDLPFGMLVGSHQDNEALYPRLLREAGRLTEEGGSLVAITQEVRLFERVLAAQEGQWTLSRMIRIKLPAGTGAGYIHPRIYLLRRR